MKVSPYDVTPKTLGRSVCPTRVGQGKQYIVKGDTIGSFACPTRVGQVKEYGA